MILLYYYIIINYIIILLYYYIIINYIIILLYYYDSFLLSLVNVSQCQTHVQIQAQAYVKAHETNMKAQALVRQQPLASPWTLSKIGASSAAGDKEEHQVVVLAKKRQDIAKR